MKIDRRIEDIVKDSANNLGSTISLLDETGEIIASSEENLVGTTDSHFENVDFDTYVLSDEESGRVYAAIDYDEYRPLRFYIEGTGTANENYAYLLRKLIIELLKTTNKKIGREEVFRRIILDKADPLEIHELIVDFKIDEQSDRCVMIVQTVNGESSAIYDAMHKIFRMNDGDIIVSLNRYVVALVKVVSEDTDMESLQELVLALYETIRNEISIEAYIGVGSIKTGLMNIRESFVEAQESINLGLTQQNNGTIFMFHKLLLERFLHTIPRDIRKQFYDLAYSDALKNVLNEEMLTTVLTFFENNLNLSEAARKLYIHRNTLIYRLEKVQRITGLDLRNFDDAVLLKTVIMLGKSLTSSNRME